MSTESLKRTSYDFENPSHISKTSKKVDLDVLKHQSESFNINKRVDINTLNKRLLEEKKKEKVKRTIILSSVLLSIGALSVLTY